MGLDMYLNKTKRLPDISLMTLDPDEVKEKNSVLYNRLKPYIVKRGTPGRYQWDSYSDEVGYWRKDNHIHQWFVANVQDGEDECNPFEVSKEQVRALLETCIKVRDDHTLAESLLPTQEGFFFGSSDYDQYYYDAIDYTINICNEALDNFDFEEHVLYYQASW